MANSSHNAMLRAIGYLSFLFLPFLVFYWMIPFVSHLTLGNDYCEFSIQFQMEMLYSIKHGCFPLYSPGFVGGATSSALTWSEVFHPLPYVAWALPGYWSGKALELNTLLRLISLGLAHLMLFLFLRRMRVGGMFAFLISFVTVYNMRMLDMFRFGASAESYVAFLLLCTAIAWQYLARSKRMGPLCIALGAYLLISAGNPQMAYYGLLGAGFVVLIAPFFLRALMPDIEISAGRVVIYYAQAFVWMALGGMLSAAYAFPFYFDFMASNAGRAAQKYIFSVGFSDNVYGNLSSIFNPFHSDVFGSFGGSTLIVVAAMLPLALLVNQKIDRVALMIWLMCAVVFVYMLGAATPLHYAFWRMFPLASSFRAPGRISMILPFLMLLLLAWLVRQKDLSFRLGGRAFLVPAYAFLAPICGALYLLFNSVPLYGLQIREIHTPARLNQIPHAAELFVLATGIATLGLLTLYGLLPRLRLALGVLLAVATIAQVTGILRYGNWIYQKWDMPTIEKMDSDKRERLSYEYHPGALLGTKDVVRHVETEGMFLEPKMARLCERWVSVGSIDEAYRRMHEGMAPDLAIVEKFDGPPSPVAPVTDASEKISLRYSSFNRVVFDVVCSRPCFLVFSWPFSSHWSATVNGAAAPIYRANGIEQALWLPADKAVVEFRYWSSSAFRGVLISCLTAIGVAWFLAGGIRRRSLRIACFVAAPIVFGSLFGIWRYSLYHGENLGTRYEWTQQSRPSLENLAYGKKTTSSSSFFLYPFLYESARGVDGEHDLHSWFSTQDEEAAWWQVDLGKEQPLGRIVIYDQKDIVQMMRQGRTDVWSQTIIPPDLANIALLPFDVLVSSNGKDYRKVRAIIRDGKTREWSIDLAGERARFVKVQLAGKGHLALAEVEVYGAAMEGH